MNAVSAFLLGVVLGFYFGSFLMWLKIRSNRRMR